MKGAEESTIAIRDEIAKEGLADEIHTTKTLCNGRCNDGPIVIIQPANIWYKNVNKASGLQIVKRHLIKGEVLEDQVLFEWGTEEVNQNI
jgi:(2Fe-2S) ferredoxin